MDQPFEKGIWFCANLRESTHHQTRRAALVLIPTTRARSVQVVRLAVVVPVVCFATGPPRKYQTSENLRMIRKGGKSTWNLKKKCDVAEGIVYVKISWSRKFQTWPFKNKSSILCPAVKSFWGWVFDRLVTGHWTITNTAARAFLLSLWLVWVPLFLAGLPIKNLQIRSLAKSGAFRWEFGDLLCVCGCWPSLWN